MKYVDVVIDNKSEYMDSFFTYLAPDDINVGDKVSIPLARKPKGAEGYVVSIDTTPGIETDKVKEIISIDKDRSLTPEIIDTAIWMRSRYGVKYIDAIRMFDVTGKRIPHHIKEYDETKLEDEPTLSEEQKYAALDICNSIDNELGKSFLIHGVTNSGKTEVYIRAVKSAIARGKSAIVLVPEIALSSQIAERFSKRFGKEQVAIMHSKLKTSERLAEWMRIKSGEAKIVVGARTAVFAPASDIGVIIIDEEHESTYKSDHNPKFETVDVAFRRSKYHNATLVLGSATPSIVSYNRAMDGIYQLIEMKNRIGNSIMPEVQIVDMRDELRSGNSSIISRKLLASITQTVKDGDQVILFLNRRGFSTQVLCPECGNNNLSFIGTGTERLEETIEELVPNAKVERFDLDTAKNSSEIKKTLRHFNSGKTNILVGTQILAKGLDFKNVGLVGIILADSSLNIPDYRSPERTFQLITQVSGRAGREGGKSKVILQTYQPEDDTIKKAANRDYYGFYEQELAHRKNMNYPPFSDIITVIFVDKKGSKTEYSSTLDHANDFRKYLLSMKNLPTGTTIYEPKLDTQRGGADRNRVIFMIKAPRGTRSGFVSAYMNYRELMIKHRSTCHIELDINPYGII